MDQAQTQRGLEVCRLLPWRADQVQETIHSSPFVFP